MEGQTSALYGHVKDNKWGIFMKQMVQQYFFIVFLYSKMIMLTYFHEYKKSNIQNLISHQNILVYSVQSQSMVYI